MKKAAIVKHFLNSSRDTIALNMMQVLTELGFGVQLATDQRSDISTFWRNSGRSFPLTAYTSQLPFTINDTFLYERFLTYLLSSRLDVDLAVDVHGDLPPYPLRKGTPLVVYVLWPVTAYLGGYSLPKYSGVRGRIYLRSFKILGDVARKLVANPVHYVTISHYVQRALKEVSGEDSDVIYPPVEVEAFSKVLGTRERRNEILVLSRISPEKQIERAIRIRNLASRGSNEWGLTIIGGLSPFNKSYYQSLKTLAANSPVKFVPNASKAEVLDAMASSSVYLHTMPGEHFGISVVEAMAAGAVPIVPHSGGPAEIVPQDFLYQSDHDAARLIQEHGELAEDERRGLSRLSQKYSEASFRGAFKDYFHRLAF